MWAFWVLKSSYLFRFENFPFWYPSKIKYTPPPTVWSFAGLNPPVGVARIAFPIWHILLKFDCTQIQSLCLWVYLLLSFLFLFFCIYFLAWPLLPTHCRCRVLLFHLTTLNGTHTLDRTPLAEGSARRRYFYLTILTTLTTDRHPHPRWDLRVYY